MVHFEQDFLELSGQQYPTPLIPNQKEDLNTATEQQKEQALAFCQSIVHRVEKYLQERFSIPAEEMIHIPTFVFVSMKEKAEINPVTGTIYLSNKYLTQLIPLEPVLIHEILHFYASRWFDFREEAEYSIKGRKIGLSIRYILEGEAVDGFGIFDEVLVSLLTKEIYASQGTELPKTEDIYLVEQGLLEEVIQKALPLKVKLWDKNSQLKEITCTDTQSVIQILQESAWSKKKTAHKLIHRNMGRILVALFKEKNLHTVATATRRRTEDESGDAYYERILGVLDL